MAKKVAPIPKGYHTATPYLVVRGAAKALAFYEKAFGAEILFSMPAPDGKSVMHAEFKIGDSILMLGDEIKQMKVWVSPQQVKGTTVGIHLYVQDVDRAFQRAVDAGCKVFSPLMNMFWGDRYGKVMDPFGHVWSLATHVKDVAPGDMAAGAEAFFASLSTGKRGKKKAK